MVGAIALADYETDEALATMREIEAMSQDNATNGAWRYTGYEDPEGIAEMAAQPWFAATEYASRFAPYVRRDAERVARSLFSAEIPDKPLLVAYLVARESRAAYAAQTARADRADLTSDGDRPADLRDDEIRREMLIDPEYRAARRDPLGRALLLRRERGIVRETHAKVHRALGYDGPGVGGTGCKWCEESDTLQR